MIATYMQGVRRVCGGGGGSVAAISPLQPEGETKNSKGELGVGVESRCKLHCYFVDKDTTPQQSVLWTQKKSYVRTYVRR